MKNTLNIYLERGVVSTFRACQCYYKDEEYIRFFSITLPWQYQSPYPLAGTALRGPIPPNSTLKWVETLLKQSS